MLAMAARRATPVLVLVVMVRLVEPVAESAAGLVALVAAAAGAVVVAAAAAGAVVVAVAAVVVAEGCAIQGCSRCG